MPVAPSKARPGTGARKASRGRPTVSAKDSGQLVSDEDLESAAGFARAHAAELEEEGRRHASGDAEAERWRKAEEEAETRRVEGMAFDDERNRRGQQQRDDDENTEDAEAANEAAKAAKDHGLVSDDGAGRYFQDVPADRLGDLSLTDPVEMRRLLGPSVRFAQHAMLLAEAQMQAGADRPSAIAFLADLYVGAGDRAYANKALRDFGAATGILDIYPLELLDHLLAFVPGFCQRVTRGTFLTSAPEQQYRAKAGQTIVLAYDPALRVRGFAVKDGARPGYLLEPTDPPGQYHLTFLSPGHFTVLISAISKDGQLFIESFECSVDEGDPDAAALVAIERERDHQLLQAAHDPETTSTERGKTDKKQDDLTFHFPRRI